MSFSNPSTPMGSLFALYSQVSAITYNPKITARNSPKESVSYANLSSVPSGITSSEGETCEGSDIACVFGIKTDEGVSASSFVNTPDHGALSAPRLPSILEAEMPCHGRNVHEDSLVGIASYTPYQYNHRYTHDPYAQRYLLRASCLPFEREATARSDMQTVLNTLCNTNALPAVVESAQKAAKGHMMEFVLRTSDPRQLAAILENAAVLMDRHGFHVVQAESRRSRTKARQAMMDYSDSIRNMPRKDRHWRLDGLPCSIVRFQLEALNRQ